MLFLYSLQTKFDTNFRGSFESVDELLKGKHSNES